MPVTARLSREFYEKPGNEATNELVEWLNQMDADYRGQLRELNELNFARFDTKVEQRFAVADAKLEQRLGALETKVIRWMFAFWTGTILALMAFLYPVLHGR